MGCCNSRIKDRNGKSDFNDDDESCVNGQRTISDLITSNLKKRQKSFISIAKKRLATNTSDYKYEYLKFNYFSFFNFIYYFKYKSLIF